MVLKLRIFWIFLNCLIFLGQKRQLHVCEFCKLQQKKKKILNKQKKSYDSVNF